MNRRMPPHTAEEATRSMRLTLLGRLEAERLACEQLAALEVGAQREASDASVAVAKDAIATLRAKWNMAAGS